MYRVLGTLSLMGRAGDPQALLRGAADIPWRAPAKACGAGRAGKPQHQREDGQVVQYEVGVRGGWKRPFEFPSMLPLLSSPLGCCFLLFHSLGAVFHGLARSGGFLWRWDLASPTTFYPCGSKHPSPDALCVFGRKLEGLSEATPSLRRLAWQARQCNGPPPPAPRPKPDAAPHYRLRFFECCSLW
jgi:hypothetical protein